MKVPVGDLVFDVSMDGPHDGRPVLLLHGFPQTARCWTGVTRRLAAAGLRTLAPDQRGYSPGARPTDVADYAIDLLVGDAVGILDALDLTEVDVVGHDWGAVVGWAVAAAYPDRVRSFTAVSVPHPAAYAWALAHDADQRERSSYIRLFRMRGKAEEVLLADDARRLRAMFGGLDPAQVDVHVRAMRQPGALSAALAWYRAILGGDDDAGGFAAGGPDPGGPVLGEVGPVSRPTTYVWSTGDIAVGRAAAQRCGQHVTGPYRMVELPDVSHWVPEEVPETLAEAVLDRVAST